MSRGSGPRVFTAIAVMTMVASFIGFIVTLMLNAFVFDEYDAYGEVPIPGSSSLQLPAGDVTVTFHTIVIGGTSGGGLPVPPLNYRIGAPEGVDEPKLVEDYGTTTTVNNDARIRIGQLHIPETGTYDIELDGNVGAYLNPTLAFGHGSSYGNLPWIFAAIFGLSVVDLVIARVWAARVRRRAVPAAGYYGPVASFGETYSPPPTYGTPPAYVPPPVQPPESFTPTDEGIRIQQLNTLARLRDSGALTEDEFESEKKRLLDGR